MAKAQRAWVGPPSAPSARPGRRSVHTLTWCGRRWLAQRRPSGQDPLKARSLGCRPFSLVGGSIVAKMFKYDADPAIARLMNCARLRQRPSLVGLLRRKTQEEQSWNLLVALPRGPHQPHYINALPKSGTPNLPTEGLGFFDSARNAKKSAPTRRFGRCMSVS